MHALSASFILGYHGCDEAVSERVLAGEDFRPSNNDYDWFGSGIYFWEANPQRGLDFAKELAATKRGKTQIKKAAVVGAIVELGLWVVGQFENMKSATLRVEFCGHMSMDRVTPMVTGIAAYGNVFNGHSERSFIVEVFRASNLPRLKDQLGRWERLGFLRWYEDAQDSN